MTQEPHARQRLVHLTDPHLTSLDGVSWRQLGLKQLLGFLSWRRKRRAIHQRHMLDSVTEAIARENVDAIVLTGDLVHIGLPQEIAVARGWLDELATVAPIILVPGNHDAYTSEALPCFNQAWDAYLKPAEDCSAYPRLWRLPLVDVIGLTSACATAPGSAMGRLGDEQFASLTTLLAESNRDKRERVRCVALHHPPFRGMTSRRRSLIEDERLGALLEQHHVDLVLHGHLHHDSKHRVGPHGWCFGTASASSVRGPEFASYRLFDIDAGAGRPQISMTLKTFEGTTFRTTEQFAW
ncbi:MAG: metallophosphoesterase [Gammaproteobacteria bacterium]|nr:metallophosphoesterase [Gammaproteobacteria bacterium]